MKWLCLITMWTCHALALPLIYSTSSHIFHDSENEKIIYYVPRDSTVKLFDNGVPMFNMAYWDIDKAGPVDGELIVTFQLKESETQTNELKYYRERGYDVRVLNYTQSNIIGEKWYIGKIEAPVYIDPKTSFEIKAKTAFSQSIVDGHLKYQSGFTSGLFEFWYRVEGVTSYLNAVATIDDTALNERFGKEFGYRRGNPVERDKIMKVMNKIFREKLVTFKKEKGSSDNVETVIKNYLLDRFFTVHKSSSVGKMQYVLKESVAPSESAGTLKLYGRYNIFQDMRILLSTDAVVNRPELFNKI